MPASSGGIEHASMTPRISANQLAACEYEVSAHGPPRAPTWHDTQRSWKIGSTSAYRTGGSGHSSGAVTVHSPAPGEAPASAAVAASMSSPDDEVQAASVQMASANSGTACTLASVCCMHCM